MKLIRFLFFLMLFSCGNPAKEYTLPNRVEKLSSKQIEVLSNNSYYVFKSYYSDRTRCPLNEERITFSKKGQIICKGGIIGTWDANRNIYFSGFAEKYVMSYISDSLIKLQTYYVLEDERDKPFTWVIYLESYNAGHSIKYDTSTVDF